MFNEFIHNLWINSINRTSTRYTPFRNIQLCLKANIKPLFNGASKTINHLKHSCDHTHCHYKAGDHALTYWQQTERGGWEKQD